MDRIHTRFGQLPVNRALIDPDCLLVHLFPALFAISIMRCSGFMKSLSVFAVKDAGYAFIFGSSNQPI